MSDTIRNTAVQAHGLTKSFGSRRAVDNLDLHVPPGRINGLVGPDGAGKTTTFRLLCGILRPDAGQVIVAGHDVREAPEEVKKRIGYLSQVFSQYPDLTVWENLDFTASLFDVPDGEWQARAEELLQASRMTPFKDRLAGNLSGGMKQKLALSCTLLHTPDVVFLDEPTTGVDPVSRRDFWSILYDLPRQGVTIVISTPYMDEAERCGTVSFMAAGRILVSGTPQDLRRQAGGDVLRLETSEPRRARDILSGHPSVMESVLFGDILHVMGRDGPKSSLEWKRALEEQGIGVTKMETSEPGLEDVFLRLAAEQRAGETE